MDIRDRECAECEHRASMIMLLALACAVLAVTAMLSTVKWREASRRGRAIAEASK